MTPDQQCLLTARAFAAARSIHVCLQFNHGLRTGDLRPFATGRPHSVPSAAVTRLSDLIDQYRPGKNK